MRFNEFFDLINEISEIDAENFNNSEITTVADMDFGSCLSYLLDPMKVNDDSYIESIEELIDSYSISDYKIEDGHLIFQLN